MRTNDSFSPRSKRENYKRTKTNLHSIEDCEGGDQITNSVFSPLNKFAINGVSLPVLQTTYDKNRKDSLTLD